MADFQVMVVPATETKFSKHSYTLDWDSAEKKWTLSEKEQVVGSSWTQGHVPSPEQLRSLLRFFRIDSGEIPISTLCRSSPGELALHHRNTADSVTIYAFLCEKCAQHWYVFQWSKDENRWLVDGRDCAFSWKRGSPLDEEDVNRLMLARRLCDAPLRPPE